MLPKLLELNSCLQYLFLFNTRQEQRKLSENKVNQIQKNMCNKRNSTLFSFDKHCIVKIVRIAKYFAHYMRMM